MRLNRRALLASCAALAVAGCGGQPPKSSISTSSYEGPKVTRIILAKARRKMFLVNGRKVLRSYKVGLGFAPVGDKKAEGDGKTPEGRYFIDRRNPESQFYLSLGISYPNARDIAEAKALGNDPGSDIFIHGESTRRRNGRDWTAGCISVRNREMLEIYTMVANGTPIDIYP